MATSRKGLGGTHPSYLRKGYSLRNGHMAQEPPPATEHFPESSSLWPVLVKILQLLSYSQHSLVPCMAWAWELESPLPSLELENLWEITVFNTLSHNFIHGETVPKVTQLIIGKAKITCSASQIRYLLYFPTSKKTTNTCLPSALE